MQKLPDHAILIEKWAGQLAAVSKSRVFSKNREESYVFFAESGKLPSFSYIRGEICVFFVKFRQFGMNFKEKECKGFLKHEARQMRRLKNSCNPNFM